MRSARDDLVRFREECKRLQIENDGLKRTRKIVTGVPEAEHEKAKEKIQVLEKRLASLQGKLTEAVSRKPERLVVKDETRYIEAEARATEAREKLHRVTELLKSARVSLVKMARQNETERGLLQSRINELEGTVRSLRSDD